MMDDACTAFIALLPFDSADIEQQVLDLFHFIFHMRRLPLTNHQPIRPSPCIAPSSSPMYVGRYINPSQCCLHAYKQVYYVGSHGTYIKHVMPSLAPRPTCFPAVQSQMAKLGPPS